MSTPADAITEMLDRALPALAARRPVFHSEADFQLALAWEIQTQHPEAQIRLEQRLLDSPRIELDVLVTIESRRFGLELKYLRAPLDPTIDGERFVLIEGAGDVDRYDTLKDIVRLERLVDQGMIAAGAAVVLSNHPGLWLPSQTGRTTGFDAFRINDGTVLEGVLDWGPTASSGTRRGRESPIVLKAKYAPTWRPYATMTAPRNGELRSLCITVGGC